MLLRVSFCTVTTIIITSFDSGSIGAGRACHEKVGYLNNHAVEFKGNRLKARKMGVLFRVSF